MNLQAAIEASMYSTAAAQLGTEEAICRADSHDGLCSFEVWTSTGECRIDTSDAPLEAVGQVYPDLNWWPMREQGEWGEEAEAQYEAQAERESLRKQRANFNAVADGGWPPYPSEY